MDHAFQSKWAHEICETFGINIKNKACIGDSDRLFHGHVKHTGVSIQFIDMKILFYFLLCFLTKIFLHPSENCV